MVAAGAVTLRDTNSPQVKLEQGARAFESDDYVAALPLLEQAAQDLPQDGRAQYLLAADYYNLHRYAEAAPFFEASLKIAPDISNAHFYLALSYMQIGRRSDAVNQLRQYLTLDPTGDMASQARQILDQLQ
jgi:tetratricopeptide (TPR) repeat protein